MVCKTKKPSSKNEQLNISSFCARMLFLLIALSSLSAQGRESDYLPGSIEVPASKSIIVLYRHPVLTGSAWPHHMYIDKQHVIGLKSRHYTQIIVSPGTHYISAGPKKNPGYVSTTIQAEVGRVHFVRYDPDTMSIDITYPAYKAKLGEVSAEAGEKDLTGFKHRWQAPLMDEVAP